MEFDWWIFTFAILLRAPWKIAYLVHMCFVDMEKIHSHLLCLLFVQVAGVQWVIGEDFRGHEMVFQSLYNLEKAVWQLSWRWTCSKCRLDYTKAPLWHWFCLLVHVSEGAIMKMTIPSLRCSVFLHWFLQCCSIVVFKPQTLERAWSVCSLVLGFLGER